MLERPKALVAQAADYFDDSAHAGLAAEQNVAGPAKVTHHGQKRVAVHRKLRKKALHRRHVGLEFALKVSRPWRSVQVEDRDGHPRVGHPKSRGIGLGEEHRIVQQCMVAAGNQRGTVTQSFALERSGSKPTFGRAQIHRHWSALLAGPKSVHSAAVQHRTFLVVVVRTRGLKNLVFFDLQFHNAGHGVAHGHGCGGTADFPTVVALLFYLEGLAFGVHRRKVRHESPVVEGRVGSRNRLGQVVGGRESVGQICVRSRKPTVLHRRAIRFNINEVYRLGGCRGTS